MMSRVLPHGSHDFGARLRAYAAPHGPAGATDAEGPLPGFDGWRWVFTPGHAPGHVSLFRDADRTLLAGDAVVTMNMDSWVEMVVKQRELSTGGSPFISDWNEYAASLQTLATLEPETLGAGHGYPMSGPELPGDLERFARHFSAPIHGRYVKEPAHTDERGVDWLPPKPTDPFPYLVGVAGLGLAAAPDAVPEEKEVSERITNAQMPRRTLTGAPSTRNADDARAGQGRHERLPVEVADIAFEPAVARLPDPPAGMFHGVFHRPAVALAVVAPVVFGDEFLLRTRRDGSRFAACRRDRQRVPAARVPPARRPLPSPPAVCSTR